jgi:hypothetical protein
VTHCDYTASSRCINVGKFLLVTTDGKDARYSCRGHLAETVLDLNTTHPPSVMVYLAGPEWTRVQLPTVPPVWRSVSEDLAELDLCRVSVGHRNKHTCDCICALARGHKGRHQCAVDVKEWRGENAVPLYDNGGTGRAAQ